MKVTIKGEAICETQVVVSSENEVIYKGILHYSDCVFDVPDEKSSCLKFHFAQFEGLAESLDERSEIDAMNEDIIMTELQYPYDTQIEISPSMESLFLIPEKMKEFEDFIVFVPDQDIKVNYLRNENEDKIKQTMKKTIKILDVLLFICLLILIFLNGITLIISLLMKVYISSIMALCIEIYLIITIKKYFSKKQ